MGLFERIFGKKNIDNSIQNEKMREDVSDGGITITSTITFNTEIPPLQGDYAKAIFLNAYQKSLPVKDDNEYQQYLLYECGIRKPSKYHYELIKDGYLEKSSLEDKLKGLKVTELKAILSELNTTTSGKKDELVKKVIEVADKDTIMKRCPNDSYSLSEKGREFLERNADYVKIHQHKNWGVDWEDYDARKKPGYSFYDIVWGVFNERVLKSQNYGRNEYLNMYQLLVEEGRKKDALEKLLIVLYIDLSGVEGEGIYTLYRDGLYTKKEAMDYFDVAIMLAPGIIGSLKEYKNIYSSDIVDRIYEVYKLPLQLCDKKLFFEIVQLVLSNTYDEESVKQKLKREYKKYIESIS